MSNIVIRVENLSKQYRLGEVGTGTISHDLNRWWHRIRGKEDPYLQIGEENDRVSKGNSEYVWALKNVSFDVQHGDVLGVIGRNGAGKSTLLKLLSRVTAPTTGVVKAKGRIASLLEVGTGFHPDLTGRENIFLNGAILGMTKAEIKRKFDEIVSFAGVERYVDTPVKRYSSGMYVRLAFAVAAHLESEILIVDEVLAVGDAEFQKKCMGKIKDVSASEGRTVLFVSHNMGSIQSICNKGLLLKNGMVNEVSDIKSVITKYVQSGNSNSVATIEPKKHLPAYVTKVEVLDERNNGMSEIEVGKRWKVRIHYTVTETISNLVPAIGVNSAQEIHIYTTWSNPVSVEPGEYFTDFNEDTLNLTVGTYAITVGMSRGAFNFQFLENIVHFEIITLINSIDQSVLRTDLGFVLNQMRSETIRLKQPV
jgi:ABC-type polysaccharide/polyol phosphate transport system ATPase subunit